MIRDTSTLSRFVDLTIYGFMDTMWAVILPQAFSMWYIVIMRTNFSMLPESLFESLRMAVIFVTVGPIIMVYPFAQKYFTKGVLVGSLKG